MAYCILHLGEDNRTLISPPVYVNVLCQHVGGITRRSIIELRQRELGVTAVELVIDRSGIYMAGV